MAYSYVREVGDGSKTSFSFNFVGSDEAYLRQSDIEVTVDEITVPFTFLSSNTIELGTAPADGAVVLIRRIMPKAETYADFSTGNNFGQEVLNNSFLQLLYVVHELLDGWFPEGFTVRQAVTFLEELLVDGNLHVNGGLTTNGANSDDPDSVVTFEHLDEVVSKYQSADASIQDQLTGNAPLEASAFSPISWHDQEIENSVTIPENKNAWSFGPHMTIAVGQSVTIGSNSFWTIANGVKGSGGSGFNGNYDYGEI